MRNDDSACRPNLRRTANVNNIAAVGEGSHVAERGFVYLDEESKMSLPIGATVKAEQ